MCNSREKCYEKAFLKALVIRIQRGHGVNIGQSSFPKHTTNSDVVLVSGLRGVIKKETEQTKIANNVTEQRYLGDHLISV